MDFTEPLTVLLLLSDIALCATGRVRVLIRITALQGLALGLIALSKPLSAHVVTLGVCTIMLKSFVFPALLEKALRQSGSQTEPKPFGGYNISLAASAVMLGLSGWFAARLPQGPGGIWGTTAFFTVLTGFFVIVTRKTALSQAIGYLVLESGIYAFGLGLPYESSATVELGLLLDIFMAVFIMGIMIYHISREFEHTDMARIAFLNDAEDYD